MLDYADYKFSVTIQSDDIALVHCLRALADFSQKDGNQRIAWEGRGEDDWKLAGEQATFRFTTPDFRGGFLREAGRLLALLPWRIISQSDDDPWPNSAPSGV